MGDTKKLAKIVYKPFDHHATLHGKQVKRFKKMAKKAKDKKSKGEYSRSALEHGQHERTLKEAAKNLKKFFTKGGK